MNAKTRFLGKKYKNAFDWQCDIDFMCSMHKNK